MRTLYERNPMKTIGKIIVLIIKIYVIILATLLGLIGFSSAMIHAAT